MDKILKEIDDIMVNSCGCDCCQTINDRLETLKEMVILMAIQLNKEIL